MKASMIGEKLMKKDEGRNTGGRWNLVNYKKALYCIIKDERGMGSGIQAKGGSMV